MIPYYNNGLFMLYPFLPPNCNKPPTLYSVLNSIVNGDKDEDEYTKIKDLAKEGRSTIFNFDYPLSEYIEKEKFETMILNHFLQRRIGFETVTAFRIQLDVKLNEIMPLYNKMFNALENWEIFNDGEITTRLGTNNTTSKNTNNTKSENTNNTKTENTNNTSNNLENTSISSNENISDRRNSDLPQNQLSELRDGNYVTNYNYDTNNNNINDNSHSEGTSQAINKGTTEITNKETANVTNNGTNLNEYNETIKRTPTDKIAILKEMQENIKSIYTMIFKDLDCLFYQLV